MKLIIMHSQCKKILHQTITKDRLVYMTFKIVSVKVNKSTYMLVVIDDNVKIQCLDYFFIIYYIF